ncbi:MAG: hypothetical protein ACI8R4_002546 [Paracoccaceae bacterium]|jgi:hypothetical protein
MTDLPAYSFTRQGRDTRTVVILIAVYTVLPAAVLLVDAAWWLMAALALPTLPALWDLYADPSAGVQLSQDRLDWHSGRRAAFVELDEVDHMRFDTRWDFSVRVTAMLRDGKRVRLPYDALPPHRAFESALTARNVKVIWHHFVNF